MNGNHRKLPRVAIAIAMTGAMLVESGEKSIAQIIPDGTLGNENSIVTPRGNVDAITGGATRGTNLFHSFERFSVPTGGTAHFDNALSVQNIFSRVTGGEISNIDGLLKANGTANLFLLNPNGIIFGPNAALHIGGSFVGTTASSVKFADGTEFSATNAQTPPLLTVSVPVGLQFGSRQGEIVVQSPPSPASGEAATEVGEDAGELTNTAQSIDERPAGTPLSSISGTLSDKNDVDLYQIFLTGERTFSATTVGQSQVDTQLFLFNADGFGIYSNDDSNKDTFQSTLSANPQFAPAASGLYYLGITKYDKEPQSHAGNIFVNSISGTEKSNENGFISSSPLTNWNNNSFGIGGSYTINLTGAQFTTSASSAPSPGFKVQPGRTLALVGGPVRLEGRRLTVPDGRVELAGVASPGTVGLNLQGNNLRLSLPNDLARADVTLINTGTNSSLIDVAGKGEGSIAINGRQINILGNSTLLAGIGLGESSSGSSGGDITLNASEGISVRNSIIKNEVNFQGSGNAGNVDITSNSFSASNATISADTFGQGKAGSVNIFASERVEFDARSRVFSEVNRQAVGSGGSIKITTGALSVSNSSELGTRTFGQGDAGRVNISAREGVSFDNEGKATSEASLSSTGNGGNINITAPQFSLSKRAKLTANTFGSGNAGNVLLDIKDGPVLVTESYINTFTMGTGNGGSIDIIARDLSLSNAEIDAGTFNQGNAGNVRINASNSVLLDKSKLYSDVVSGEGDGGSIGIVARTLYLTNGAQIETSTSGAGNAGNVRVNEADSVNISGARSGLFSSTEFGASGMGGAIEVQARNLRIADGGVLQARSQSDFNGGHITVNVGNLELTGGGQILTTATSGGNAGSINIDATDSVTIISDASGIFANTQPKSTGIGGNIDLKTTNLNITDGGRISVNSTGTGNGGSLQVMASDSINLRQQASVSAETENGSGGDITLEARNLLLLRNNSNISAKAGNSANGGNIRIDAPLVVAIPSENSNIIATAVQGQGGIITIKTNSTFGLQSLPSTTERSDINANSASGINGEVQINTPGIDPGQGLTTLPQDLVNLSTLVPQGCKPSGGESQFVIAGRSGLPPNPTQPLNGDTVLANFQTPSGTEGTLKPLSDKPLAVNPLQALPTRTPDLVEATGWVVNSHGQVELVANASKLALHNPWQRATSCSQVQ